MSWIERGNEFIAEVSGGRGVIRQSRNEHHQTVFHARVEAVDGTFLQELPLEYREFEEAEEYMTFGLWMLDMLTEAARQTWSPDPARLEAALTYCLSLLPATYPESHRARLELIRKWVRGEDVLDRLLIPVIRADRSFPLDWIDSESGVEAQTPYGRATIRIMQGVYQLVLTDPTGVIFRDPTMPLNHYLDIDVAKTAVLKILEKLDNPNLTEVNLACIEFTLAIGQALLPQDTDIMNYVRLGFLSSRLAEILP